MFLKSFVTVKNLNLKHNLATKLLILISTNLHSTIGEKMTKHELSVIVLPDYVKSVMIGLLSDGYIVFSATSKNGSLVLTQALACLCLIF